MGIRTVENRKYGGIIVGIAIRRQVGKAKIFRFRRGNGVYGARADMHYQDQYDYFVPSSITNIESAASRSAFANAISAWQILSDQEKLIYKTRSIHKHMSGYNLFIKEYMHRYFLIEALSYYGTRIYGDLIYGNQ